MNNEFTIYQRSVELSKQIHKRTLTFPFIEQVSGIADELRRSSKSVSQNLAEGYGYLKDQPLRCKSFLMKCIRNNEECRVWLSYAVDLGYISHEGYERLNAECEDIARLLFGLFKRVMQEMNNL